MDEVKQAKLLCALVYTAADVIGGRLSGKPVDPKEAVDRADSFATYMVAKMGEAENAK